MPPTLTQTQRHLLTLIARNNGTLLLEAMINDHAMRVLLSRQGGLMGHTAPEGAPEWLTGYCTVGDRFVGPGRDTPRVTISATQIRALGNDLPADVQAEIRRCLDAHRAELHRTSRWCRCPYAEIAPNPHGRPCTRHHPTAAEDAEHHHRSAELRTWTTALLRQALNPAAGQQLDLFATLR